ncbi:putative isoprenylcysteine alpha-carbonyl methylesterase ICMEL1 [Glycine max]|nr:putative isoprenylcysteine alpha-carbonyl methylesterase ICMEL1 [Glycine max]
MHRCENFITKYLNWTYILHTPNYHHRALDSAILSHLPSILLRAKEYNDDDIDNDHSVSLLQHSLPSFKEISFNKPTLPRASSFAITRNKASRTRHCFYQKQLRHSLPSVSVDTASTTTTATATTTRSSLGREVASETFLLTRLGFKMLRYLEVGYKWITRFLALGCYAVLLFPGFIQVGYYYFFSNQIRRSIVYGDKPRNRLDLYLPKNSNGTKPVVAFVTGGARIIGYKAWGSLLGQQLSDRDIIVACIDYREPSVMIYDASQGISFVCNNIAEYGGDPNRIYLMAWGSQLGHILLHVQLWSRQSKRQIMARTRGLGRAIGRVVGRDRAADEDAGDVPERRRPTASARRLRVHQMTTEGRDMAEDVADMTDDVPEQPTEAPEMRADAQDADSGEGSDGDDAAEGFPGGPRDPSVLTSFAEHVAHAVWSGQERPDLKLVSHGRKLTLIGRPVPEIEGLVAATGLSPLIDCSVITGDPGLISAFVERWHNETSTFHLPVGELTITLDDVSSILHLPITGALHSFHALSTEEARFLLTELLEVSAEEARAETALTRGAYVRLGWVRDIYETRCQARRWIVAARAYLLHLVGCTLFANKSATYVHVVHLDAFRDLAHSGGYAWGVTALVHMYDQLDEACRTTTRQLAGYLTLFQCWIYEHFPSVHQCVTDDTYQETSPHASRWLTSKAHMKGITGASYRARCDGLTVTDVSWLPYMEHRGVRAFQEISSFQGQLRWGPMIVAVRPERVVRQFGYIQSIPPPPVSARLSQDQIDDRWMEFADHLLPAGQPCLVPGQAADQQRDAPAADPEDYIQPPSPQVPVAFDPPPYVDDYEGYEAIAHRLERVLNLRIVTAGTELYDIMQDCLTIARGGPSADGTLTCFAQYSLFNLIDHFHSRGLYRSIFLRIMEEEESLRMFSPEVMIQDPNIGNANSLLPPVVFFHGSGNYSIPLDACKTFSEALKRIGFSTFFLSIYDINKIKELFHLKSFGPRFES